jgi:tRNA (Thr-GGU) A37 N-methylase
MHLELQDRPPAVMWYLHLARPWPERVACMATSTQQLGGRGGGHGVVATRADTRPAVVAKRLASLERH